MRSCVFISCLILLCCSMPVFAEGNSRSPLQASEETLDSVKRLKSTLTDQGDSKKSNLVKDSISWDTGKVQSSGESNMMRMVQGLGLCVGLFLVGVSIARRINPKLRVTNEQRLFVRSRVPLSNKTQLVLAEVDGREVLVAVGQENVAFLQNLEGQVQQESGVMRPTVVESGKEFICEEELQHIA